METQQEFYLADSSDMGNAITIEKTGNIYTYDGGDKVINNYQAGEVVALTSDYQGIDLNGNSFFVYSSSGSLEIQNSRDKFIGYSAGDENVLVYSYLGGSSGVIDGRGKSQIELMIGADNQNNQIYAGSGGSSLWGAGGESNTLVGGEGDDTFFYFKGTGYTDNDGVSHASNDVISSVNTNDVVWLYDVTFDDFESTGITSDRITFTLNDGSALTVVNSAQETKFKLSDGAGGWTYLTAVKDGDGGYWE